MTDVERCETKRRKGWFPWCDLGRVAGIYDFHGAIWDSGRGEFKRSAWRTKMQHLADRWYSLPVPQWEYWFWLIIVRSGSVNTYGSPDGYFKTRGWSRWSDKPWRTALEHTRWTVKCILLNYTVSILNYLELGRRSVMFPTDYGYIANEAIGSWWICLLKVHEWCLKSSDRKSQWKLVELTSQNGFRHIRHLGTILDFSVPKLGIWYRIWNLVPFWCLGTISGVLALSLEYRLRDFDTCSRGRSSLKVISTWRVTYGWE